MDSIIIAALIAASAAVINNLISHWLSGRKKDDSGDTVFLHITEYIPIPVELEELGWTGSLVFYAKRLFHFIIVILCYFIPIGLGAYVGYLLGSDGGEIVGIIIGLAIGYWIVRRI